jgi:hypothetical protein
MTIDPLSATALGAVAKWLCGQTGRSPEGNLSAAYEATAGRVMVAFVNECGDLLQEALLATVPRVGEEVELILLPKVDPASQPGLETSNWSRFERLKSVLKILILGQDKQIDKLIEKSVESTDLPNPKILNGTVLRVRWTPLVASPEHAVTAATIVLKVQDVTSRGSEVQIAGSPAE